VQVLAEEALHLRPDLHVHIPGAPSNAASAEPAWYVDHRHAEPRPYLDHITWFDADGQRIEVAA
jgi:hypothetical protein